MIGEVKKRKERMARGNIFDKGKAVDDDLIVTQSNGIESEVQDDSSRSENDIDVDDEDIKPIYDEKAMAEVQLIAECNIFAIGQQHTKQLEIINEYRVDQYPEQHQVKSPMVDSSPDNQTTNYSKHSLESENILLKKIVAQLQKDFSRMEAHCIAHKLKYQNQALKSGKDGQILNETTNKAKIKKEIDVLETMNIELEHVAKLRKENEASKKHYKDLYDSIKITRSKTIEQTTSLLANNVDLKAQIQEKEVNSHAKSQSHKTRNNNKPVEQKSHTQKPNRKIFTRHMFSPNKTSIVYKKISPRSDLRWKPIGKKFKSVGLRWIPIGKLFDSYTSNVDSEPTHSSNEDIPNIHECKQTLDLSAGTAINEVPKVDMIVISSIIELESLFGPLFEEYFNEKNQVVSKCFTVTTADASIKRQQQQDSTLPTTLTADGNFDLLDDDEPSQPIDGWEDQRVNAMKSSEVGVSQPKSFATVVNNVPKPLKKGSWMIRNQPLILTKWAPNLDLSKDKVTKVPTWVKIYKVPVVAYSDDGLSLIASQIGKPVMLDAFTSAMCNDPWGKIRYARALIEISADQELKKDVTMAAPLPNGKGHTKERMMVEYEWQPKRYVECLVLGHDSNGCPKRVIVPVHDTNNVQIDGFTTLHNRKNKGKRSNQETNTSTSTKAKAATVENHASTSMKATDVVLNNSFETPNEEDRTEWNDGPTWQNAKRTVNVINESDSEEDVKQMVLDTPPGQYTKEASTLSKETSNGSWCSKDTQIILGWNYNNVDVNIISQDDQAMHARVWIKDDKKEVFCSFIYAHNRYSQRRALWDNLGDIGLLKKLDRVMANLEFNDVFAGAFAVFQPYPTLDHSPAVLKIPMCAKAGLKPFKFTNILTGHDRFKVAARTGWSLPVSGFLMYCVVKKLKNLKKPFRKLLYEKGNLHVKVERLRTKLDQVQRDLDADPFSTVLREEEMIRKSPIILSKWSPSVSLKRGEVTTVPPIMLDAFTSPVCVESWGRISFARALIEIDAAVGLKKEVIMAILEEEGDGYIKEVVRVKYEWKPPHCVDCQSFGHDTLSCPKCVREKAHNTPARVAKSTTMDDNDDGFTEVKCRKKKKGVEFDEEAAVLAYASSFSGGNQLEEEDFDFYDGYEDQALDELKNALGLIPSLPKSTTYFCNVLNHTKTTILQILPFEEGRLPVKYLGVPLVSSRLIYRDCKELIEKVQHQIRDWKNKSLSVAGSSRVGFCGLQVNRRKVSLKWHGRLCVSLKRRVVLALGDLSSLTKRLWSLIYGTFYLVKNLYGLKLVHTYKLRGRNFFELPFRGSMTWSWRKILQLRPLIRDHVWYRIGDGATCSLWFDRWCAISPLASIVSSHDIHRAGLDMSSIVRDVIHNGGWDWPLDLSFNTIDVPNISSSRDILEWRSDSGVTMPFKVMAGLSNCMGSITVIVDTLTPISKRRSARSVIAKLVVAACCYFIWQERNFILFKNQKRSPQQVIECIKSSIRLKLLSCSFKKSRDAMEAIRL
uniref:Uncharacterized protein n=1 Tax=Tanacetum cinerariifolium TaxID=118510 RepID=A0A6L2J4C9_TANCI|nr:hypothetical protein [Tanacetum cinerariifolium]